MRTFYTWLLAQTYRRDAIGDLSIFFVDEVENHPNQKTKNHLLGFLVMQSNEDEYLTMAFHTAWREYKKFRKNI